MTTSIIDATITKTGLTPAYAGTDANGNQTASFRKDKTTNYARITHTTSNEIHVFIGRDNGNGDPIDYVDSHDYKTAAGAAKFLKTWGFAA